jgi:hypothetical protein
MQKLVAYIFNNHKQNLKTKFIDEHMFSFICFFNFFLLFSLRFFFFFLELLLGRHKIALGGSFQIDKTNHLNFFN